MGRNHCKSYIANGSALNRRAEDTIETKPIAIPTHGRSIASFATVNLPSRNIKDISNTIQHFNARK